MTVKNQAPPDAEEQWFSHDPNACPPLHELIVSEARSVEEALARLGPDTSATEIQERLTHCGLKISLERVREVLGQIRPPRP